MRLNVDRAGSPLVLSIVELVRNHETIAFAFTPSVGALKPVILRLAISAFTYQSVAVAWKSDEGSGSVTGSEKEIEIYSRCSGGSPGRRLDGGSGRNGGRRSWSRPRGAEVVYASVSTLGGATVAH